MPVGNSTSITWPPLVHQDNELPIAKYQNYCGLYFN